MRAVQFFNNRDTYAREMAMYDDAQLREAMLPVVQASSNEGGDLVGPFHFAFPPFAMCVLGCASRLLHFASRLGCDFMCIRVAMSLACHVTIVCGCYIECPVHSQEDVRAIMLRSL